MATGITSFSDLFKTDFIVNNFKSKSFIFSIGIIFSIALILVPLPGVFLDFFMVMNIVLALVILITVVNTKNNLEFSIFPTLLLWGTLFRLVINVSSTRLILSKGLTFDGNVVRAFADFVAGGSFVIGVIIFIIIIIVQLLVITKGASRASEVSARFKLDSLPGKQIAIDADLSSGLIDESEATRRREEVQQEADFYGSMDGATKFINGEVIASIVIVFVNIIGGIVTGTMVHNESISQAMESYLRFAIGDGLVASIPSLVIAVASGIVVTRTVSKNNIASDLFKQLFHNPAIFSILGVFVLILAFIPGFPALVMVPMSLGLLYIAYSIQKRTSVDERVDSKDEVPSEEEDLSPEKIAEAIQVAPLEVELGYELLPLVDPLKGGDFLDRVKKARKQLALALGLLIPKVSIMDNMELEGNQYQIKINGSVFGGGELFPDKLLAIPANAEPMTLEGVEPVKEPVFGITAYWVNQEDKDLLEKKGFTLADSPTTITTHLVELIKVNASEIFGRKETELVLKSVESNNSALVVEVAKVDGHVGILQKIFGNLLEEDISIRNMNLILEVVSDFGKTTNVYDLIEKVRHRLARQISAKYADSSKNMNLLTLGHEWETKLLQALQETPEGRFLNLNHIELKDFVLRLKESMDAMGKAGYLPVLMVDTVLRRVVKDVVKKSLGELVVISRDEVADGYYTQIIQQV